MGAACLHTQHKEGETGTARGGGALVDGFYRYKNLKCIGKTYLLALTEAGQWHDGQGVVPTTVMLCEAVAEAQLLWKQLPCVTGAVQEPQCGSAQPSVPVLQALPFERTLSLFTSNPRALLYLYLQHRHSQAWITQGPLQFECMHHVQMTHNTPQHNYTCPTAPTTAAPCS